MQVCTHFYQNKQQYPQDLVEQAELELPFTKGCKMNSGLWMEQEIELSEVRNPRRGQGERGEKAGEKASEGLIEYSRNWEVMEHLAKVEDQATCCRC